VPFARYQLALGARGITVQKLGEAEVMADAGISDMLLTFNVIGAPKLRRLAGLARRTDISVVADNEAVVAGLGQAGEASGRHLSVLVECDTGAKRNGVQNPRRRRICRPSSDPGRSWRPHDLPSPACAGG
jgi:D-serine deaminase-like pyridoxal phosphate-dependent protein